MIDQRLLNALKGENRERPPVWLMRQAGRYLPEYRKIREKASFTEMTQSPELIAEVTQLPLRRYPLDAAILFSDILVVLEMLGKSFEVVEKVGPVIENPLNNSRDVEGLQITPSIETLGYVAEGIKLLKEDLKVPLIGFCGGPFTVATYLIEGGSSRNFNKTMRWLYQDPKGFHLLLDKIADASIDYLNMQIDSGVDAIQIFDTWAGELSATKRLTECLGYHEKMCAAVKKRGIPVMLFAKGDSAFYEELAKAKPTGISLDSRCHLQKVRKTVGPNLVLQGNVNPHVLYADKDVIRSEVKQTLKQMQGDPAYIMNLGHGVLPDLDPEHVKAFIETVVEFNG